MFSILFIPEHCKLYVGQSLYDIYGMYNTLLLGSWYSTHLSLEYISSKITYGPNSFVQHQYTVCIRQQL